MAGRHLITIAGTLAGLVSAACAAPSSLAAPAAGGVPLLAAQPLAPKVLLNNKGRFASAQMRRDGPGHAAALQINVFTKPPKPWQSQLLIPLKRGIHVGDKLVFSFAERSADPHKKANIAASLQYTHAPWSDLWMKSIPAGRHWKTVQGHITVMQNLRRADVAVYFTLGGQTQRVQICDLTLTRVGRGAVATSFNGRWLAAAQARIKKYRMAPLAVLVRNQHGAPVAGATVHVNMLRHAFPFGTAVSAEMLMRPSPDRHRYRRTLLKYYNHVEIENGLKWGRWANPRERAVTLRAVRWLRAHHLRIRGHNLVWPAWKYMPPYVHALAAHKKQLTRAITRHVSSEVRAIGNNVDCWDVVNEPLDNHVLQDILGNRIVLDCYRAAHRANPSIPLYVNEYNIVADNGDDVAQQNSYATLIGYLINHRAPLGGIGLQCHFGMQLTPPARVVAILDRFARFKKLLTVTEFDINVPNQAVQAAYMRAFLTAAFSVPQVVGINQWGFWAGRDWLPQCALWNKQWRLRPEGKAFIQLVRHTWWTRVHGKTGAGGRYRIRGFLGTYDVRVTAHGKTVTVHTVLRQPGDKVTVTIP